MSGSLLHSFAGTNGIYPKTSVIYQGGILYGTASDGGVHLKTEHCLVIIYQQIL